MKTIQKINLVSGLNFGDVLSVYSGQDGKCCCGCSGKHYYNSGLRAKAGRSRGYKVDDDEVNDKMVLRVLNKLKKAEANDPDSIEHGRSYFSTVQGKRLYIVYIS